MIENSPNTLQSISTSSYFSISKWHILIVYYRNLTRKFWHFLGCRVHQPIKSNAGIKGQLSFLWNLGQLMCNCTKMKSVTNTETLSAFPKIQLVSLFIWKLEYNFIKTMLLGKKKRAQKSLKYLHLCSNDTLVQDDCFYWSFLFYCLNPSLLWNGLQHKSYEGWQQIETCSTRFRVVCMDHTLQIHFDFKN